MTTENETGLVTRGSMGIVDVELLRLQTQQMDNIYKSLMSEDTDYGVIPGTKKPTLYLPGAQLLRGWAGLQPHFTVDSEGTNLEAGIFFYQVTCSLYKHNPDTLEDDYIGSGLGACTSLENKYRYRWVSKNQIPAGMDIKGLATKSNGSGNNSWTTYRLDNDNPHDLMNTILKMAKKRAFIDAILTVTGASRIFTQDVEDNAEPKEKKPPVGQPKTKASTATKSKPDPDVIDADRFWRYARKITGKTAGDAIAKQLGVDSMEKWTLTLEEALDKLAALNSVDDWKVLEI